MLILFMAADTTQMWAVLLMFGGNCLHLQDQGGWVV
jgi:hypothetical protein